MRNRTRTIAAAVFTACVLALPSTGDTENGYWEPPAIHPSTAALSTVLSKIAANEGDLSGGRVEHYSIASNGITFRP